MEPDQRCSKCQIDSDKADACPLPPQLGLNDWTVFAADSVGQELLLPQEAEVEVCSWLVHMATQLDMLSNAEKLYGNIVFDPLGEIMDFDIKKLDYDMLDIGFNNWMNTLASGEILLDIVNGLLSHLQPKNAESAQSSGADIKGTQLPVRRMLHTSPNKSAFCIFLMNYDHLYNDFLAPILKRLRPGDAGCRSGETRTNVRQVLAQVQHIGYTLLRNCYTTREWTWKALMLVVMTLMALTESLPEGLDHVYCCLTGEPSTVELALPELRKAYQTVRDSQLPFPTDIKAISERHCRFPYKRVLKQGPINFKSTLAVEFGLE